MNKLTKSVFLPVAAVLMLGGASVSAQAACLKGGEIQNAVSGGEIMSLNEILGHAGIGGSSKVLQPVKVCDHGGQLFYELSILDKNGNARKLVLNARTGAS